MDSNSNCLLWRKGINRDCREAIEWYKRAAEQGIPNAQYNLGVIYMNGDGVRKNISKAIENLAKLRFA